jgi:hypothetical protein
MTTASANGAARVTSTGSSRSEPRSEVLGNSPDQTPASHAECLQRDRGFGALQLDAVKAIVGEANHQQSRALNTYPAEQWLMGWLKGRPPMTYPISNK